MSKSKTKICKQCGAEMPANAKFCTSCGAKNKKSLFARPWFWILVAVVVVIAIAGAGGSGNKNSGTQKVGEVSNSESSAETTKEDSQQEVESKEEESVAEESSAEESSSTPEIKDAYEVGDILMDGDMKIVYAASGVYNEDNEYLQPKDGYNYIFLKLAFINEGKSDASVSIYSFDCYADGYSVDMYYGGEEDLSATLSSGRSTMGYIYFEVPQDAQDIEVEYTPNVLLSDKKIKFAFAGDQDSGYTPELNTTRTDGAYAVGDIVEIGNVTITYLTCEDYESDNMFVQPKDGAHYVTLEFEFENTGTSDEYISSYNFDCYADGQACTQIYIREDDLQATISAGRKAKGTVTFEVPDDAEVIEAEFNENVWTSNRAVFTVK